MKYTNDELLGLIIEAIQDKKGIDIVDLNLSALEYAIADHFVICHGNSNTQVEAIADSVIEKVKEKLNVKVWHKEGYQNAQWILLDFAGIIVHVFQKEYREFYSLEELWADGKIKYFEND
jgi:ribosome-associated protein